MKKAFLLLLFLTSTLSQKCKKPKVFTFKQSIFSDTFISREMSVTRSLKRINLVRNLCALHSVKDPPPGSAFPICKLKMMKKNHYMIFYNLEKSVVFMKAFFIKKDLIL